jgi:hypothetical protein
LEAGIASQFILSGWGFLDQTIDDVIRGNAIAFRGECNNHAVPKHWATQFLNIFYRYVGSSMQQRSGFATKD